MVDSSRAEYCFEMSFGCAQCGKYFPHVQALALHARVHHLSAVQRPPPACSLRPGFEQAVASPERISRELRPRPVPADLVRRSSAGIADIQPAVLQPRGALPSRVVGQRRDYCGLQTESMKHKLGVEALFSSDWWSMFESVRTESGATQVSPFLLCKGSSVDCLSVSLSVCLSVCLPVCLSVCLFVCLPRCLSRECVFLERVSRECISSVYLERVSRACI